MFSRILRCTLIGMILLVALLGGSTHTVSAQRGDQFIGYEMPCPYSNAAFYQKGLFPRYVTATHSLILVDPQTGQTVRALDTFTDDLQLINWSPDCRFLSGIVGKIGTARDDSYSTGSFWQLWKVALWDTMNGERAHTFPRMAGIYPPEDAVIWSPQSDYAIALSGTITLDLYRRSQRAQYDFLWSRTSNFSLRLGGGVSSSGADSDLFVGTNWNDGLFTQYFWDDSRRWIWANDTQGAVAFSVYSGAQTFTALAAPDPGPSRNPVQSGRFFLSEDKSKVVVYTIIGWTDQEDADKGTPGMSVYDVDSKRGISVNVEGFVASYAGYTGDHSIALSPDNRYLVAGDFSLRVWDLQNLPTDPRNRLPTYRHAGPKASIWSLRFVAPLIVETKGEAGRQKWDIITGELIP